MCIIFHGSCSFSLYSIVVFIVNVQHGLSTYVRSKTIEHQCDTNHSIRHVCVGLSDRLAFALKQAFSHVHVFFFFFFFCA